MEDQEIGTCTVLGYQTLLRIEGYPPPEYGWIHLLFTIFCVVTSKSRITDDKETSSGIRSNFHDSLAKQPSNPIIPNIETPSSQAQTSIPCRSTKTEQTKLQNIPTNSIPQNAAKGKPYLASQTGLTILPLTPTSNPQMPSSQPTQSLRPSSLHAIPAVNAPNARSVAPNVLVANPTPSVCRA